ncbi:MAG: hypothetical protein AB4041_18510 [Microcystaceae cyanobacterium]
MLTIQANKNGSFDRFIKNNKGKIALASTLTTFSALFLAINPAKANDYEYFMDDCLGQGFSLSICLEDVPVVMCMEDGYSLRQCEERLGYSSPSPQPSRSFDQEMRRIERREQRWQRSVDSINESICLASDSCSF